MRHRSCVSEYKLVYKLCLDNNNLQFDSELGPLIFSPAPVSSSTQVGMVSNRNLSTFSTLGCSPRWSPLDVKGTLSRGLARKCPVWHGTEHQPINVTKLNVVQSYISARPPSGKVYLINCIIYDFGTGRSVAVSVCRKENFRPQLAFFRVNILSPLKIM